METREVIEELEFIRLRIYRLRLRCKRAPWFGHLMKAAEGIIITSKAAVERISRATE